MRVLWTAASGMAAQQLRVDTIGQNLANVNTTGYKKARLEFQDLIYARLGPAEGVSAAAVPVAPRLEVGTGVYVAASRRVFDRGMLRQTDGELDLAIDGPGFFRVRLPDGGEAYTRDGTFRRDGDGRLVTADGHPLVWDGGLLPATAGKVTVSADGLVSVRPPDGSEPVLVGRIMLALFPDPGGLEAAGRNLWRAAVAAGNPLLVRPGDGGAGHLVQGALEGSNVQVMEEIMELIMAQRAYELNARAVRSADEMWGMANNLRR